ncbi:MAG: hypothetical protein A2Y82_05220 [Candidatus Buchananbacteria bacterium RBG_13_36_9]|uniref:Archease domain-containing protein n=1 Tax=Candidatus Buchananbacteria bacterium RBG_13_36_9 TaxID=1797530 RepID=A0A1G1XPD3_9BACT|nr:MAG: hypothetical protein A2Y82_05220 [Candidatus Buchananbacteria bacterium RBG_13_36_9]
MKKYEILEHTADIKLRSFGQNKEEVFSNMAVGMFETITDLDAIDKNDEVSREIEADALDSPALLVDFLSKLLSLSDIGNEIYNRFEISFMQTDTETWWLKAHAYGYGVKRFKTEIKAVTYNELKLEENEEGNWVAEVVFDI